MKKLDLFVIRTFFSSFFYVFFIIIFLLLLQQLLPNLEDLVGKNVNPFAYIKLIFYFSVVMTPIAFPISIMMSSLMTFGNMGEHLELTAMKCSGISLPRIMRSVLVFSFLSVIFAYISNNYIVPKAALQAYSTIYNIRHTNPAFELKEGIFYNGLPGFSIKIQKKYPDGKSLKGVYIYDHTKSTKNDNIILADSAQMYFSNNKSHLLMKLFYGNQYAVAKGAISTASTSQQGNIAPFLRQKFDSTIIVFSMKSFEQLNVDAKTFSSHRFMKNTFELLDMELLAKHKYLSSSVKSTLRISDKYPDLPLLTNVNLKQNYINKIKELDKIKLEKDSISKYKMILNNYKKKYFNSLDSTQNKYQDSELVPEKYVLDSFYTQISEELSAYLSSVKNEQTNWFNHINLNEKNATDAIHKSQNIDSLSISKYIKKIISYISDNQSNKLRVLNNSLNASKQLESHYQYASQTNKKNKENVIFISMEIHKKVALATACIVMFLIGGPLGAIVKKGGLGLPVVIAVLFFIIFYIIGTNGEKLAREEIIQPWVGAWASVYCLLPFGIWFVVKARDDSRLFDADIYLIMWDRIKSVLTKQKQ